MYGKKMKHKGACVCPKQPKVAHVAHVQSCTC